MQNLKNLIGVVVVAAKKITEEEKRMLFRFLFLFLGLLGVLLILLSQIIGDDENDSLKFVGFILLVLLPISLVSFLEF